MIAGRDAVPGGETHHEADAHRQNQRPDRGSRLLERHRSEVDRDLRSLRLLALLAGWLTEMEIARRRRHLHWRLCADWNVASAFSVPRDRRIDRSLGRRLAR